MSNRVLVLAEDPSLELPLSSALADGGLESRVAPPSADVVATRRAFAPGVLVVDLCRDAPAALIAVASLHTQDAEPALPVLFLGSGREPIAGLEDARANGGHGYVQRPASAQQVVDAVRELLGLPSQALTDPSALIPAPVTRTLRPTLDGMEHVAPKVPEEMLEFPTVPTLPGAGDGQPEATAALEKLLRPSEGGFQEGELPALLWRCLQQRVTGRLDLLRPGTETPERQVFFEDGHPVLVQGDAPQDRLEVFLASRGYLPADAPSRVTGHSTPRRTAALLVREGLLKSHEVFALLREHLRERWAALGEWREGAFTFRPDRADESDLVLLDEPPTASLWRVVRRGYSVSRLVPLLGGPATVLRVDTPAELASVSPDVARVVEALDGSRTLEDAVLSRGLAEDDVFQVAFLLATVGAAAVRSRGSSTGGRAPGGARDVELEIDRRRVLEMRQRCREADYFKVLGVDRGASRAEVAEALRALRERMDPAHFQDPLLQDLKDPLLEIATVLGETAEVLLDDSLRARYRDHLLAP